MVLQLNDELRMALQADGLPLCIHDDQTKSQYILISQDEYLRLLREELQREIKVAVDEVERGEVAEWDVEAVIADAKRRFGTEELS